MDERDDDLNTDDLKTGELNNDELTDTDESKDVVESKNVVEDAAPVIAVRTPSYLKLPGRGTPQRRRLVLGVSFLVVAALVATLLQPARSILLTPGPALELGSRIHPNEHRAPGGFYLTTVKAQDQREWQRLVGELFKPAHAEYVPRSEIGLSSAATARREMRESENAARRAASSVVGHTVTATADTGPVGGASGGLMLALAFIDAASPGSLTGGRHVAGTGTISAEGAVGAVGGSRLKAVASVAAGARVFLASEKDVTAARKGGPSLRVVSVSSLAEAVLWLCQHGGRDAVCAQAAASSATKAENAPALSSR